MHAGFTTRASAGYPNGGWRVAISRTSGLWFAVRRARRSSVTSLNAMARACPSSTHPVLGEGSLPPHVEAQCLGYGDGLVDRDDRVLKVHVFRFDRTEVAAPKITGCEIDAVQPRAGEIDVSQRATLAGGTGKVCLPPRVSLKDARPRPAPGKPTKDQSPPETCIWSKSHVSNMLPTNLHSVNRLSKNLQETKVQFMKAPA